MAETINKKITVSTYDTSYTLQPEQFQDALGPGLERWNWIKSLRVPDIQEYYHRHIYPVEEFLNDIEDFDNVLSVPLNSYIDPLGDMGAFVFQTKHMHGEIVAFYLMEIASSNPEDDRTISFNKSEAIRKSTTYEYHLAHYLFFQHIHAADYINNNEHKKLLDSAEGYKKTVLSSLDTIDRSSESALQLLEDTKIRFVEVGEKINLKQRDRIRRYRKVFDKVRKEAAAARNDAMSDLKNAHNALLAKLDIEASVEYWGRKEIDHKKSSKAWFGLIILTATLTFAMPVAYYLLGGVSSLAASKHVSAQHPTNSNAATDQSKEKVQPSGDKQVSASNDLPDETLKKVFFASGIADLTGAALLVTLMSVILRLCLRQFNTITLLHRDAEERVTMMKTYLALANEGKLTSDGDMKIVLDTLFRASYTAGVPDQNPATPIELIVKAITEKRP